MNDFNNLAELVLFQGDNFKNPHSLNYKIEKKSISYSSQDLLNNSKYIASALKDLGFKKDSKLANYSYQNPIWLMVDFGAILAGGITVPFFHNISKENFFYQLSHSGADFLFTDNEDILVNKELKKYKTKIIFNGKLKQKHPGLNITNLEDLITSGKKLSKQYNYKELAKKIDPQNTATIIYTSGSTGVPKGVELTHSNLISQIKSSTEFFQLNPKDIALSYLPLSHIFERMVMMYYISTGLSVHFVDDINNLGTRLKEVRPTVMTTVPRMLEKVYGKINDASSESGLLKKILVKSAIKRATQKDIEAKKTLIDKIFNKLVYKKFAAALGGKIESIICGGSALSREMESFYNNIGVSVYCGYGLTESSPVICANSKKYHKRYTAGKLYPNIQAKITNDQELLVKGPNVMKGYYKDPKRTSDTIDKDGWLKTGDLAIIDSDDFITIRGRKKELFKSSNGKYIAPIPIEQKLVQNLNFLIGAIIIADNRKFTSALLFPDFTAFEPLKKKLKFTGHDQELLESKKLQEYLNHKITQINLGLNHWEQIQKFKLITKQISIESGEITPSMKLKRSALEEKFSKEIDELYS